MQDEMFQPANGNISLQICIVKISSCQGNYISVEKSKSAVFMCSSWQLRGQLQLLHVCFMLNSSVQAFLH